MNTLHAVLAAAGAPPGDLSVLEESELGTLVDAGGLTLLVSPPSDPDGTGVLTLRAVGPPPPALPDRPTALVAELPRAGTISLQSAEGMRALATELGDRLAPLTVIRLLVSQATAAGLPTLVVGDEQLALLGPRQRERDGRLEPLVIEPRPGGGWSARFTTVTHLITRGAPLLVAVHDWHAELSAQRGLVWEIAERGPPMPAGA